MGKSILNKKVATRKKTTPKKPKSTTVTTTKRYTCQMCHSEKISDYFFRDERNPGGYSLYCKDCLNKKALDPKTKILTKNGLLTVLRLLNRPYLDENWKKIKIMDCAEQSKIGNYMRVVSLNINKNKTFEDSDESWSITEDQEDCTDNMIYSEDWKGTYTDRDLKSLNKLYQGYQNDFNLTNISQQDYARKIAKASLYLDKCLDEYQRGKCSDAQVKAAREAFDTLSKSAKFAESERTQNAGLGCFGQVFDEVEKNIWIPKFEPVDKDTYDLLIDQLSNIEKSV